MQLLTTRTMPLLPQWCQSFEEGETRMQRRIADGRLIALFPHHRGITLVLGMPAPYNRLGVYADSWEYSQDILAYWSFHRWDPISEVEPTGWSHHRATGRHRLSGNPHHEYSQIDGTLEEQILHALSVTLDTDMSVRLVQEMAIEREDTFPLAGARCFLAYVEYVRCPHRPKCQIPYTVFWYHGRCVVLNKWQIAFFEQEPLVYRLTAEEVTQ